MERAIIQSDKGAEDLCIAVINQALKDYGTAKTQKNNSKLVSIEKFLMDNIYLDYIGVVSGKIDHQYGEYIINKINHK